MHTCQEYQEDLRCWATQVRWTPDLAHCPHPVRACQEQQEKDGQRRDPKRNMCTPWSTGGICCRMDEKSLAFTMWAALVPPGHKAQLNNMMVTVLEDLLELQIKPGGSSTRNKPHLSKTIHPLIHSFIQPSIRPSTQPPTHPSIHSFTYSSIHPPICLPPHPSIYSFNHSPTQLSIYLSICPSIHPSNHSLL